MSTLRNWWRGVCRGSGSAPEFSRFSDIKNLQPNQKNNSEPLESINPTTLRDYWPFCRRAVMTKFFRSNIKLLVINFLSPRAGQPAPQCQVGWMWKNPDENDAMLRAILGTVPRHESTVFADRKAFVHSPHGGLTCKKHLVHIYSADFKCQHFNESK